jgi:outer membrane protein OmpA-like peptidoglycan-associated protein
LSENRAGAVADYLSMRGVQKVRMATLGYGETQPIADNGTEAGRAANRRVEIRIVPVAG